MILGVQFDKKGSDDLPMLSRNGKAFTQKHFIQTKPIGNKSKSLPPNSGDAENNQYGDEE